LGTLNQPLGGHHRDRGREHAENLYGLLAAWLKTHL